MKAPVFHVATLSPKQQIALRCAAQNLMQLYVKSYLDSFDGQVGGEALIMREFTRIQRAFSRYEKVTKCLPFPDDFNEVHANVFLFDGMGIKQLLGALENFDPNNSVLPLDEIALVSEVWEDTYKLLQESAKHECTAEDIKKLGLRRM